MSSPIVYCFVGEIKNRRPRNTAQYGHSNDWKHELEVVLSRRISEADHGQGSVLGKDFCYAYRVKNELTFFAVSTGIVSAPAVEFIEELSEKYNTNFNLASEIRMFNQRFHESRLALSIARTLRNFNARREERQPLLGNHHGDLERAQMDEEIDRFIGLCGCNCVIAILIIVLIILVSVLLSR